MNKTTWHIRASIPWDSITKGKSRFWVGFVKLGFSANKKGQICRYDSHYKKKIPVTTLKEAIDKTDLGKNKNSISEFRKIKSFKRKSIMTMKKGNFLLSTA